MKNAPPLICPACAAAMEPDAVMAWCKHERVLVVKRPGTNDGWTVNSNIADHEVRHLFARVEAIRSYRREMDRTAGGNPAIEALLSEVAPPANLDAATEARIESEVEAHMERFKKRLDEQRGLN